MYSTTQYQRPFLCANTRSGFQDMINTKTEVVHVNEFYSYTNIYKPGFSGNSNLENTTRTQTKNKMENHGSAQCRLITSCFGTDTLIGLELDFRNIFENFSK